MATKKRRHKTDSEEEVLERRSHWAQRLNRPVSESDRAARSRCMQLIDSGYGSITWSDLLGER